MKKKFAALLGIAVGAFLLGYGALTLAYPSPAPYGVAQYHGYYKGAIDSSGDFVLQNTHSDPPNGYSAISPATNSATEFINEIMARLSGSAWDKTGASFIIDTMMGGSRNRPPQAAQITAWKNAVNAYAAAGRVNWNTNYCYTLNTYYQRDRNNPSSGTDDASYFDDSGCSSAIVFTNPNGTHYAIRRQCANPLGFPEPLTSLAPPVTFTISGNTTVSNANPIPGTTISFGYYVQNTGPTSTSPTTVTWKAMNSTSGATVASGSAGVMAKGALLLKHTESYTIPVATAPGTKICRRTDATPHTQAGGTYTGTPVCATVAYSYTLVPTVNPIVTDSSGNPVSGVAEPGDNITFQFTVKNTGLTVSQSVSCTEYGITKVGFYNFTAPAYDTASSPGYVPPPDTCPQTFASGSLTTIATEVVPAASITLNHTLCRTLVIVPATAAGATAKAEACVQIGAKPYMQVLGGDVSAGNPQTSGGACGATPTAAIVGWNKENSPTFNGAGVQFAAMAVNNIYDFATAQGNAAGAAPPSGLAFANNTVTSGGLFGGKFGSPDCIPDYYANLPTTFTSLPATPINLATLATGTYTVNAPGGVAISGLLVPGRRVAIYVTGDVLIDNPINYPPANWTVGNLPLFELIVKGNIYISKNVASVDGLFVAQPNGASGGTIYTCAKTTLPVLSIQTTDPTYASQCSTTKLTINGSFVANQVQLLRTTGTLSQNNAPAEQFNYSPALWMAVPPNQPTNNSYDSITSLPPIL